MYNKEAQQVSEILSYKITLTLHRQFQADVQE